MTAESHEAKSARFFVPGRIEVLGKHTDYAGGSSLTCATEQGLRASVEFRDDGRWVLFDRDREAAYETFPPVGEYAPSDWTRYPWTIARRVSRDFFTSRSPHAFRGANVTWSSDLPRAAGLSSSSALMVLLFLALRECERLEEREDYGQAISSNELLAAYVAALESGRPFGPFEGDAGVGTRGGSGDHTAILCSQAGRLGLYSYDPPQRRRAVALPPGLVFAIGVSGVEACKTGNAREMYGRATRLAAAGVQSWRAATGGEQVDFGAMLEVSTATEIQAHLEAAQHPEFTGEELSRRFAHFVREETELLPRAVDALTRGDLIEFGSTVDQSQSAAEHLLLNQIPETRDLQRSARELGAHAASAFGAGFGGSVWALVPVAEAQSFIQRWSHAYAERHPDRREAARFLLTGAAGPARTSEEQL